jgi:hypothetical protein
LALDLRLVRASDGGILLSNRILSHETQSALARMHQRPTATREERKAELERLLSGRRKYAHHVMAGYWYLPIAINTSDVSSVRGVGAPEIGYRLYENFGPFDNALFYGFQLSAFIAPTKPVIAGGAISALFGGTIRFSHALIPRLRFAAQAGGLIAGAFGNTLIVGGSMEVITHLGIVVSGAAFYLPKSEGTSGDVQGASFMTGLGYVFE